MSQHRPVPGISQGPKQFSPSNHVPMQSPLQQPPQAPAVDGIAEQMQDLAMEIYCRVVSNHICAGLATSARCAELASDAKTAARIYFEGVPTNG